jgi:hypothetical protein
MGGFLQTAVSDAPRTTWRSYLRSRIGRIRYSTSVSDTALAFLDSFRTANNSSGVGQSGFWLLPWRILN